MILQRLGETDIVNATAREVASRGTKPDSRHHRGIFRDIHDFPCGISPIGVNGPDGFGGGKRMFMQNRIPQKPIQFNKGLLGQNKILVLRMRFDKLDGHGMMDITGDSRGKQNVRVAGGHLRSLSTASSM